MRAGRKGRAGTAYVEYFLTAAATAMATWAVWQTQIPSIRNNVLEPTRDQIMGQIRGTVSIP